MSQYVSWKTYILQFTYWFQVNASLIYSLAIFFCTQQAYSMVIYGLAEHWNKANFVSKQQECYLLKNSLQTTSGNFMLQYVSWKTYVLQFTYQNGSLYTRA